MDYLDLKLDNETFLQKLWFKKSHNSFDRNMCLFWKVWSQISDVNSIKYFLFSPFRKVAPALALECLQLDPLRSWRLAEKSPLRRQKKQHEKRVKMNVKWQWEGQSVEQAQRHKDECKVSLSPLESSSLWRMAGKASFFRMYHSESEPSRSLQIQPGVTCSFFNRTQMSKNPAAVIRMNVWLRGANLNPGQRVKKTFKLTLNSLLLWHRVLAIQHVFMSSRYFENAFSCVQRAGVSRGQLIHHTAARRGSNWHLALKLVTVASTEKMTRKDQDVFYKSDLIFNK